jgi:hypothetical protein
MTAAATLRRHATVKASGNGVSIGALHPAYRTGRSIFPSRVFDPDEVQRVLKDGHQSRKIGKFVTKGRYKGFFIYTLTLEERATCPATCKAWAFCFGNNMQAAERITSGPALEAALWEELASLQAKHPAAFSSGFTSSATSTASTMPSCGTRRLRLIRRSTSSAIPRASRPEKSDN